MAQELSPVDQRTPRTPDSGERTATRPVFVPPTDIYETSDNISSSPRYLVAPLRARIVNTRRYQQVYNEYADGDYERVFTLSEDIDRERIEATYEDGVLHLVSRANPTS
jgi:HSP20 family protein